MSKIVETLDARWDSVTDHGDYYEARVLQDLSLVTNPWQMDALPLFKASIVDVFGYTLGAISATTFLGQVMVANPAALVAGVTGAGSYQSLPLNSNPSLASSGGANVLMLEPSVADVGDDWHVRPTMNQNSLDVSLGELLTGFERWSWRVSFSGVPAGEIQIVAFVRDAYRILGAVS